MNDLLIVGGGLAGSILAAEATSRGLHFKWMMSETIPTASFAAYGICNPVQFRNKVPAWKVDEFYSISRSFFIQQEDWLGSRLMRELSIHHLVAEAEEATLWRQNVESTSLWNFTNGDLQTEILDQVGEGFCGSIVINKAFYLPIAEYVLKVRAHLKKLITVANFDPCLLCKKEDAWDYRGEHYNEVVFCEGAHANNNPFFKQLPFNPCKGEILLLLIPMLDMEVAIHKKMVLIPIGNHQFIFGATYSWDDLSFEGSVKGKAELEEVLIEILGNKYTYEILAHKAGIRPSISDRRPLVGWHPIYKGIGMLNGFGSMGLMVGPAAAKNILDNWQSQTPILPDWDINRFKKRLLKNE